MNKTNEYCLPVSYGLEEHLPRLGCNPATIYLKAHFNKIFKGEQKGVVVFKLVEWAKFFGVTKPTILAQLKILEEIKFIEWVVKSNNRHTPNKIKIVKDKQMSDFTVLHKKGLLSKNSDSNQNEQPKRKLPLKNLNGKQDDCHVENKGKSEGYRKETLTVERVTVKNPERCLYGNPCNPVINNEFLAPKDVKGYKDVKDNIYTAIFNHWNKQKIITHREIKKFIPHINARLKHYTPEEIKEAISNYSAILKSDKHYFSHKWGLDEFLTRKGGLDKFMTVNDPFTNYLKGNNRGGNSDDRFKAIGKSI